MNKNEVSEFLVALGCENITVQEGSDWVKASCPLAPWLHEDKNDKKPSFGIKAVSGANQYPEYHCFTCGKQGLLPQLMDNLHRFSEHHYERASRILSECDLLGNEDAISRGRKRIIVPKKKFDNVILLV